MLISRRALSLMFVIVLGSAALSAPLRAAENESAKLCPGTALCQEGEDGSACLERLGSPGTALEKEKQADFRLTCKIRASCPGPDNVQFPKRCSEIGIKAGPAPCSAKDKQANYSAYKKSFFSWLANYKVMMTKIGCSEFVVPTGFTERDIASMPEKCICDMLNKMQLAMKEEFLIISFMVPDAWKSPDTR